jgi:iron complex outermembrane receptor protein
MMLSPEPVEIVSVEAARLEEKSRTGIFGERSIFDTPFTVNSYDKELIEKQSSVSANQVLKNDPALTNATAAGGFTGFTLGFRGFPAGADAVSFMGLGPGAIFSGSLGQLYSVERVDVVKGPSASLGAFSPQASVGGSVSVIPKRPLKGALTAFNLGFRERGIISGHADVSRRVTDDLAVRVNLAAEKGKTFYQGNDERRVAALALSYRITDTLKLDLGYDMIHVRSEGYQNAYVLASGVKVPKAPNPLQQHFQRWAYLEQEWDYGYGSLSWEFAEKTTFTVDAIRGERRRPILSTGTGLITSSSGDMTLRPSYLAKGTVYDPFFGLNAYVQSEQETGPIRHDLSLSFMYNGFDFKNATSAPLATIASNLYHPRYVDRPVLVPLATGRVSEVDARTYALTDSMHWEDWTLLLGAKNTTLAFANYDVQSGARTLNQNDSATSPVAALSYAITPKLTSYMSFAEGLEKGGVAPATAANANEIQPSIRSQQWEVGSKAKIGESVLLSTALFQIERDLEYLRADSNTYVQDGLQRNRGLEVSLQGHLTRDFSLTGGYMVVDAKIVHLGPLSGKRPPGVPHWTLPLFAEYSFSPSFSGSFGLYHFDRQYVDPANTQRLKEWTRYDAGLSHRLPFEDYRLSLSAYVENIGNQKYWSSAAGGQLALGGPEIWKFALRAEI